MEQDLAIIAKKFWKIVKVAYFMLRKGISKAKLLADLNIIMKRGKIAGKLAAINHLLFHHHHHHHRHHSAAAEEPQLSYPSPLNEYEYSCTTSPASSTFRLSLNLNKRKINARSPPPPLLYDSDLLAAAVEVAGSVAPSPVVRQLRITDSPFPLRGIEEDNRVDEAAEKFIMKFYKNLMNQNAISS